MPFSACQSSSKCIAHSFFAISRMRQKKRRGQHTICLCPVTVDRKAKRKTSPGQASQAALFHLPTRGARGYPQSAASGVLFIKIWYARPAAKEANAMESYAVVVCVVKGMHSADACTRRRSTGPGKAVVTEIGFLFLATNEGMNPLLSQSEREREVLLSRWLGTGWGKSQTSPPSLFLSQINVVITSDHGMSTLENLKIINMDDYLPHPAGNIQVACGRGGYMNILPIPGREDRVRKIHTHSLLPLCSSYYTRQG